jgi:NAD(P)-dependent dehydrogenase (short-subunit alcohol dehydrogenase family)
MVYVEAFHDVLITTDATSMSSKSLPGIKQFRLDSHAAIVTGGGKGLGAAMAAGLASAGANLMLLGRDIAAADQIANEIASEFGVDAISYGVDVTDLKGVQAAVDAAKDRWGRIDILINSAGINIRGPITDLTGEQFDQVIRTNVHGSWNACRSVLPIMKEQRYGRIINMASTLGVVGLANRTPYATSKGAVVQLTRALALEIAHFGVTCNAICPGPFLTEMNVPIADTEEAKKHIVGAVALERWGRMEEIQGAAIYLASPASSFTTGSLLYVDGGWTAR